VRSCCCSVCRSGGLGYDQWHKPKIESQGCVLYPQAPKDGKDGKREKESCDQTTDLNTFVLG